MSRPSSSSISPFFFSTHTPTTELYTLSLHDALPLSAMDRHPATEPDRVKEWRRVILGCGERHRDAALPVAFRRHSVGWSYQFNADGFQGPNQRRRWIYGGGDERRGVGDERSGEFDGRFSGGD